ATCVGLWVTPAVAATAGFAAGGGAGTPGSDCAWAAAVVSQSAAHARLVETTRPGGPGNRIGLPHRCCKACASEVPARHFTVRFRSLTVTWPGCYSGSAATPRFNIDGIDTDLTMLFGQVQAFIAVARTGNVSRAAQCLYVTQPALTASIEALATRPGETLLARH